MASADSCPFSLASRPGLLLVQPSGRSPQVSALTVPAALLSLPLWPLIASGFVASCHLAQPRGLLLSSWSSSRRFASGFLQTPPRGDALAFR